MSQHLRIARMSRIGLIAIFTFGQVNAQDVLIRDAKVYTLGTETPLENTDVLLRDGKIAAVGHSLSPTPAAMAIDARNQPLTPGLFGGISALGLTEVPHESSTVDSVAGSDAPGWHQQWRPEFDVTLAYNPRSAVVPVTRIEGVTWTVLDTSSGDSIMGGQGAAITLDGRFDAVLPGSRTLFMQWGGGLNALSDGSRAGQYMLLDQAIREARSGSPPSSEDLLHAAGRTALLKYLNGGRVVVSVQRAADILGLIATARRAGFKLIVAGGTEAWVVAEELARADVPVILDPTDNLPETFDQLGARLDNAERLHRAGVRIAFSGGYSRAIRQLAGNAVAHGLPWDVALASITRTPAEIFGLGATRGRIAVGQSADVVLWDGDPLEITTIAERVWIGGRPVALRSRQTLLRDRYLQAQPR